jgi:hypothetical protein
MKVIFSNLKGLMIAAVAFINLALAGSAYAIVFDLTSDHCTGTLRPRTVWHRDSVAKRSKRRHHRGPGERYWLGTNGRC